jgi:hypothetical protein
MKELVQKLEESLEIRIPEYSWSFLKEVGYAEIYGEQIYFI